MKSILLILIIFLNTCTPTNMNHPNNDDKKTVNPITTIEEIANTNTIDPNAQQQNFDYVVAEAAVGNIEGIPFTLDGIFTTQQNNNDILTTTMDINKERFVDIVTGTTIDWKDGVQLYVVNIEKKADQQKGNVYFKVIKLEKK